MATAEIECCRISVFQRSPDLFGVDGKHCRILHLRAVRLDGDAFEARHDMEMQVEHRLPARCFVELIDRDAVGLDEWVAFEYAKVRRFYATRMKLPDRTEIEFFDGPHTINGKGSFEVLRRHLRWP